jgi:hypothetical protein
MDRDDVEYEWVQCTYTDPSSMWDLPISRRVFTPTNPSSIAKRQQKSVSLLHILLELYPEYQSSRSTLERSKLTSGGVDTTLAEVGQRPPESLLTY